MRKQYTEIETVLETGERAISFYMFSSYFLSYTVRKRHWTAGQIFIGSLKATLKRKSCIYRRRDNVGGHLHFVV